MAPQQIVFVKNVGNILGVSLESMPEVHVPQLCTEWVDDVVWWNIHGRTARLLALKGTYLFLFRMTGFGVEILRFVEDQAINVSDVSHSKAEEE